MYFALLPLLLIAATLQEPLFDYLNYYHAANVAGVSSWFLASGSVLQVLRGTVTYVEMRVQGQIQSRFPLLTADVWMTIRLEDAPFTYFSSIFAVTSDSSASAVYGRYLNLSASEFEPTRPFSAVTPIRGLVNRLPASVTAPAFPPPTMLAAIARLENRHTPNSTDPSHYPQPTGDANSTSSASIPTLTPLPVLASSSNGGPSSRQATNSYGKFETTGQPTIIVAQIVVVASTSGVSQSLPSSFPPGSHIHTVATLVQLATSTSVPVISPADYPALFAAMGVPSGRSSWVRQHAWILLSALLVPIQLVIGIRLYLARRRRTETGHSGLLSPTIVHHPAPAPEEAERSDLLELRRLREELGDLLSIIRENGISPAQLREYVKLVIQPSVRRSPSTRAPSVTSPSDAGTRGTPNPPGGFAATAEDSSQAIDSAPRRGDSSFGSDAPVASCSVKRRKSVVRASGNLSPRAHKSLTRTSGVSMGEVSPASEPSRSCARSGAPRVGGSANDLDNAGSDVFGPVMTSSSVREREPGSLAAGRAQRTTATARGADPTRSGIVLPPSQAGPSLLREPLPPQSSRYVSFGTLYPPPPAAGPSNAGTRTPNPPSGFAATAEDPSKSIGSGPRWSDQSSESDAPVASCTVERRKSQVRANANVSPLVHKSQRRTSGLSMGEVSRTPEPFRSRDQAGAPRDGDSAANSPEDAGSTQFEPAWTSTPRESDSLAASPASWTTAPARSVDPTRSGIALSSQAGPSLIREPLPPRSSGYVSFGTLAVDLYPPRPSAPEPDTTLDSSSSAEA